MLRSWGSAYSIIYILKVPYLTPPGARSGPLISTQYRILRYVSIWNPTPEPLKLNMGKRGSPLNNIERESKLKLLGEFRAFIVKRMEGRTKNDFFVLRDIAQAFSHERGIQIDTTYAGRMLRQLDFTYGRRYHNSKSYVALDVPRTG